MAEGRVKTSHSVSAPALRYSRRYLSQPNVVAAVDEMSSLFEAEDGCPRVIPLDLVLEAGRSIP